MLLIVLYHLPAHILTDSVISQFKVQITQTSLNNWTAWPCSSLQGNTTQLAKRNGDHLTGSAERTGSADVNDG